MDSEPKVFKWSDMPKETLFAGQLTRTAVRSDGAIVTLNWHKPSDVRHKPHSHPFDQLVLIVSGTLMLVIDGKELLMEPGTVLRVPANVPHTGYAVGEEEVLNIDVFAPPREDYLFLAVNQGAYGEITRLQSSGEIPSISSQHVLDPAL